MDIQRCKEWTDFKSQLRPLSKKAKGDAFEVLTKYYLQLEPKYATDLKNVWLLKEVPASIHKKLNLPTTDEGIDIIVEAKDGEFWAIQCKYKEDESVSVTRKELATFTDLAFGICKGISYALVCTNADRFSHKLKKYGERIGFCSGEDYRKLDREFFERISKLLTKESPRPKPYNPLKHQQRAMREAQEHFIVGQNSRGKLIHPCGSGKSLTGYWIAEKLGAKKILVAVPSLALVRQTLDVWSREAWANNVNINWMAVCSDESVADTQKDDISVLTQDLGVHVHTDPDEIARWLKSNNEDMNVLFTTYQSGKVTAQSARSADITFDLGIMDEAHKTTGDVKSLFSHLHYDRNIPIRKRIYMTATERHYKGASDQIASMDDIDLYGETFELMSFKEALESDPPILSDYRIITILISREEIESLIEKNVIVRPDKGKWDKEIEATMLASLIAHRKASEKYGISHTVSYHSSIAKAKAFMDSQERFNMVFNDYKSIDAFHVKGSMPTSQRAKQLDEFVRSDYSIITNARCLNEGVDVPDIDCVLFADPRKSTIDIVQAVGRALRISKGKKFGYVLVPVVISNESMRTGELEKGAYDDILMVLRALSSNDDRIVEYFRSISQGKKVKGSDTPIDIDIPMGTVIDADKFLESVQERVWPRLAKLSWRPFKEAREFARSLELKSGEEWKSFYKGKMPDKGTFPDDIPAKPDFTYRDKGWVSVGDWLGTGRVSNRFREFRPFGEAREFARSLDLKSYNEWIKFSNGEMPEKGIRPEDIPFRPDRTYKDKGWAGIGDWLGTGNAFKRKRKSRPFEDAREFARSLELKSENEWKSFCKGELPEKGTRPDGIPYSPRHTYKDKGWVGIGDWLGKKESIVVYRPFEEAREYARSLDLKSYKEWIEFCKGGMPDKGTLPEDIPSSPTTVYKDKGWVGVGDWLGTRNVASFNKEFRPFKEAREFAQSLGLKGSEEWFKFCKGEMHEKGELPDDIPASPAHQYRNKGWVSWPDWVGTARKFRSFKKAREFARSLGLKRESEWKKFCKGEMSEKGIRPDDIPYAPKYMYLGAGWVSWPDWLGTDKKKK